MAHPEYQSPEQVVESLFTRDLGISRSSLKPLHEDMHRGFISETYAGPELNTIVKILKDPTQENKVNLAMHSLALQRIQHKLPYLLHVPRILQTGKIGGRPALIESRLPNVMTDRKLDILKLGDTSEKIKFLEEALKFLSILSGMGITATDFKANDFDISPKSTIPFIKQLPAFGLVDLGASYIDGNSINLWPSKEKAWERALVGTKNMVGQLFGFAGENVVPKSTQVHSFKEVSGILTSKLANIPKNSSLY